MQKKCKTCGVWKPVKDFHKQGRKNGLQQYKADCKDCANAEARRKYHEGKYKHWDKKAAYIRARSRALTRLSKLVPELYQMCMEEELAKEPEYGK